MTSNKISFNQTITIKIEYDAFLKPHLIFIQLIDVVQFFLDLRNLIMIAL